MIDDKLPQYLDINEIRRRNMRLQAQRHTLDVLVQKIGVHKNQMRHWIGRNPSRNISDEVARKAERVLKLPHNWMDNPHYEEESVVEQMMSLPPQDFISTMMERAIKLGTQAALDSQTSHFEKIAELERRIQRLESLASLAEHVPQAQNDRPRSAKAQNKKENNTKV